MRSKYLFSFTKISGLIFVFGLHQGYLPTNNGRLIPLEIVDTIEVNSASSNKVLSIQIVTNQTPNNTLPRHLPTVLDVISVQLQMFFCLSLENSHKFFIKLCSQSKKNDNIKSLHPQINLN